MARYIDADLLLIKMDGRYRQIIDVVDDSLAEGFLAVDRLIKEQPTADVKEVVHGEWKSLHSSFSAIRQSYGCNRCKGWNDYKSNFCPNCGADMRGVKANAKTDSI